MSLSSAITDTIEGWSNRWGKRLHDFTSDVIRWGLENMLDVLGEAAAPLVTPIIQRIESVATIPPELQPIFNEIQNPSGEIASVLAAKVGGDVTSGAVGRVLDALFLPFSYDVNSKLHPALPSESQLVAYWLRGLLSDADLTSYLHQLGANDLTIDVIKELSQDRLGVADVIRMWLRDNTAGESLVKELTDSGISTARVGILKQLAEHLPSTMDALSFAARGVYNTSIVNKYGLNGELPSDAVTEAAKDGTYAANLAKYWAAHWQLPNPATSMDMLRRGIINEDDVDTLMQVTNIAPYWRDKVKQESYTIYNRLDVRRMWDLAIVDDAGLQQAYLEMGYDEAHATVMSQWTKVYQMFPEIIARYTNGYIDLDGVRNELSALGISDDKVEWLIERKVKTLQPARVATEKTLTKAEILKGLYNGVISNSDAMTLLQGMGYDANEASLVIAINMPASSTAASKAQKQLTRSDIINEYEKGLLDAADATSQLVAIRYTLADAQSLIALADATMQAKANPKLKTLTKADIVAGVKKAIITAEEGYNMLLSIGYDDADATFILDINIPATTATGSPDTFSEFNQIVQTYAKSVGLPSKAVPPELIDAEWKVKSANIAFNIAKANKNPKLADYQTTLTNAQYLYNRLLSQYNGVK